MPEKARPSREEQAARELGHTAVRPWVEETTAKLLFRQRYRLRQVVQHLVGELRKIISIDEKGNLLDFAMNDKCAAGTGRFLEVTAGRLHVGIDQIGALSRVSVLDGELQILRMFLKLLGTDGARHALDRVRQALRFIVLALDEGLSNHRKIISMITDRPVMLAILECLRLFPHHGVTDPPRGPPWPAAGPRSIHPVTPRPSCHHRFRPNPDYS